MISTDIGIWVNAILTIIIYSYYIRSRQNIAFQFAQSTMVGCAIGIIIVKGMAEVVDKIAFSKIYLGNISYVIPIIIGLLIYTKYIPHYSYYARIPISIIVSAGLAVGTRTAVETMIYKQIISAYNLNIIGVDFLKALESIIFLFGLITVSYYFIFTLNPKISNKLQPISRWGRYFMMFYFGARFGTTVIYRVVLFQGRIQFLINTWLGLGL